MTTKRLFSPLVMAVFFVTVIIEMSFSQVNLQTVGRYEYAQFDGVWYTVVQGKQGDLVDTKHLLVRLKDKTDISTFDFSKAGLPRFRDVRGRFAEGFYELEIPKGADPFEVARRLQNTGRFEEVLFNVFMKVDGIPNDPQYTNQWNLGKVSMAGAWDITTGSSNIIVAVIDVGADYNHEDLQANRWSGIGYDFYDNDSNPYPSDSARHGTAVAGILGAVTNNSLGVAGVAGGWGGVGGIRIMHLDAGWRDANGDEWIGLSASAQAIDSAAAWGTRVISMSFGSLSGYSAWESAINRAVDNYGVVCVASSGNYRSGQSTAVRYPAAYGNVIAVGATVQNDNRKELNDGSGENWWGSCYGSQLDVMAPGIFVWTTDITGSSGYSTGNYYDRFNGTSASAPHVAGLAGLIRSVNPSLTWQQVRDILRNSADKVSGMGGNNFTNEYGYGRINAYRALLKLVTPAPPANLRITNAQSQGSSPNLQWNANSEPDLSHYKVWRTTNPVNWSVIATTTQTSYTDFDVVISSSSPSTYYYYVTAVNAAGRESDPSTIVSINGETYQRWVQGEQPMDDVIVPKEFSLSQNYPNPFNPETEISFALPERSTIKLTVLDVLGREIVTLSDGERPAGYHRIRWNGSDVSGNKVGSGLYFYRLSATGESGKQFTKVMKMLMAK